MLLRPSITQAIGILTIMLPFMQMTGPLCMPHVRVETKRSFNSCWTAATLNSATLPTNMVGLPCTWRVAVHRLISSNSWWTNLTVQTLKWKQMTVNCPVKLLPTKASGMWKISCGVACG
eukprot:3136362-Ditylum_brightwellii.AAC.1